MDLNLLDTYNRNNLKPKIMKRKLLTLTLAVALMASSATAKEYYVATSGNDNNSGELESPFRTISKASSIMEAGDECIIMEGVYHEVLTPQNSGTTSNPITYRSYEDDHVVIDATEPVTGWIKHSGNIYKASKALPFEAIANTLFLDEKIMDVARWPNNADDDRFSFDGERIDGGSDSTIEMSTMPDVDLVGSYFCYLGAHSGTTWSREITAHKSKTIEFEAVDITKWPYTPHNPTIFRNNNRGQLYLFGSLDLLDHAGEWYYDAEGQTIYAIFPENAAPMDGSVKAGVRISTVEISQDYIHIDGLNLFGGVIKVGGDHCQITNCKIQNCSQSLGSFIGISAHADYASIMVGGSDLLIENNLIEYGLGNGIMAISDGNTHEDIYVHNNVIRYFNTIGIHAGPIRSNAKRMVITNNTIYTCGRDGVSTSGRHTEIAYNDVYDCMKINNDGGVFYTVGNDELKDTEIHHNWFHDSYGPEYADGRAAGIYLDNNSKGYDVYNNIVSDITWSGLMINWYNADINFYHNTIWNAGFSMGRWANGYIMERIRAENNFASTISNDADGAKWIGTELRSNFINEASPFVDADNGDFRPRQNSILIDRGSVIDGFTNRYSGNSPDVGAYEYGRGTWQIGASWADEVVDKINFESMKGSRIAYGKLDSEDDIFKVMVGEKKKKK